MFKEDLTFAQTRLKAQEMRNQFFKCGDISLKNHYRQIFSSVSNLLDEGTVPVKMSEYSFRLIQATDWSKIKNIRRKNAQELINKLSL